MSDIIASAAAGGAADQGVSSTAEFQFNDAGKLDGTAARLQLRLPPLGSPGNRDKHVYEIIVGGRVTGGTTTNFTARLDFGTSATIGTNTTIAASATSAVNSASGNWLIKATIYVDADADDMKGFFEEWIFETYTSPSFIDATPTIDPDTEIGFTVTGQFSASDAGNNATCEFFHAKAIS